MIRGLLSAAGWAVLTLGTALAQSQPPTAGLTGFTFLVTAADQTLPSLPNDSPGLQLPGKIVLCNPQQTFSATDETPNSSWVNINWYGKTSVPGTPPAGPTEQIAPGVCEVQWYVSVPPHISVNGDGPPVVIGVGQ